MKDYCKELVESTDLLIYPVYKKKESTDETVIGLDDLNWNEQFRSRINVCGFTFDFEALYDPISPEVIIESLKSANVVPHGHKD